MSVDEAKLEAMFQDLKIKELFQDLKAAVENLDESISRFDQSISRFEANVTNRLDRTEASLNAIRVLPQIRYPRPRGYFTVTELHSVINPRRRRIGHLG